MKAARSSQFWLIALLLSVAIGAALPLLTAYRGRRRAAIDFALGEKRIYSYSTPRTFRHETEKGTVWAIFFRSILQDAEYVPAHEKYMLSYIYTTSYNDAMQKCIATSSPNAIIKECSEEEFIGIIADSWNRDAWVAINAFPASIGEGLAPIVVDYLWHRDSGYCVIDGMHIGAKGPISWRSLNSRFTLVRCGLPPHDTIIVVAQSGRVAAQLWR